MYKIVEHAAGLCEVFLHVTSADNQFKYWKKVGPSPISSDYFENDLLYDILGVGKSAKTKAEKFCREYDGFWERPIKETIINKEDE